MKIETNRVLSIRLKFGTHTVSQQWLNHGIMILLDTEKEFQRWLKVICNS